MVTNTPNSFSTGGGALRMTAPGGAATVMLSRTISLSTAGLRSPTEAAHA